MRTYTPNPEIEATIAAKIGAAQAAGTDLEALIDGDEDQQRELLDTLGVTPDEQRYLAEQHVFRVAQTVIGQRIHEALISSGFKIERDEIIPCLQAHFDNLDERAA